MNRLRPLALVVIAGCGAASHHPTSGDPNWPATPPTQTVTCGAALPTCDDASSLRIRWPEGARAPADARIAIDGTEVVPAEAELGICVAPGTHVLRIDGAATQNVEILPGAETRVALSRAPNGSLASETTLGTIDVGQLVASLGHAELPTIAYDAPPEERRLFAQSLGAAFDAWRARLARVTAIAEQSGESALLAASRDHEARASSVAITIAEDRPSADRVASIRRAMETEIAASATMIPIERSCPLYSFDDPADVLAPVTVEVRPYVGTSASVVRIRVAVDDVEVLDTGAPRAVALADRTIVDGVVPPGEHVVTAEVTFADPDGASPRRPQLPTLRLTVPRTGSRVLVRARGDGTVELTAP